MKDAGRPPTKKLVNSEALLEFILAFIAAGILLVGLVRIGIWFGANYAKSHYHYQEGRFFAGNIMAYNQTSRNSTAPVSIGGNATYPDLPYQRLNLTEDWLFGKDPEYTITGKNYTVATVSADEICRLPPSQGGCLGEPGCGSDPETLNMECPCYVHCVCDIEMNKTITKMNNEIAEHNGTISDYEGQISELAPLIRDKCHWFDPRCWFRSQEPKLDDQSKKDIKQAITVFWDNRNQTIVDRDVLKNKTENYPPCCDETNSTLQKECLKRTDLNANGLWCSGTATNFKARFQNEYNDLADSIEKLNQTNKAILDAPATFIPPWPHIFLASAAIIPYCEWWYPDNQAAQNACCKSDSIFTNILKWFGILPDPGILRNCRQPSPPDCLGDNNSTCSLEKVYERNRDVLIPEAQVRQANLTYIIDHLDDCCSIYPRDFENQTKCLNRVSSGGAP